MKCGLFGRKLSHSYSPAIHSHFADYSYVLWEVEPGELENFLRNGDFQGLNVTMPYKKAVIPYLDELSPVAKELGAVNTIVRRNGKLIGHNTDYFGFLTMLQHSGLCPVGKKCLVLGSGGASQVAQLVLRQMGGNVTVISRTGENNYDHLTSHKDAAILVNATPVGMYPNTGVSPVHLKLFPALEGVLDVVYNPARTQLLMDAEALGIPCWNGLQMLVAQAKEASEWFTGDAIPKEKIQQIHSILRRQMENIVLIGMPGCGKSTVGKLLSEKTGKTFVDTDAEIEKLAQKTIPDIFGQDGEEAFRQLETQVLSTIGKRSNLVIATGGGCVTREENYPLLHQNGKVIYLQRPTALLPTAFRPLSQSQDLSEMYRKRAPLYQRFADHTVTNHSTPEEAAEAIMEILL